MTKRNKITWSLAVSVSVATWLFGCLVLHVKEPSFFCFHYLAVFSVLGRDVIMPSGSSEWSRRAAVEPKSSGSLKSSITSTVQTAGSGSK